MDRTRTRAIRPIALATVVVLAIAACGGGAQASPTTAPTNPPPATTAATAPPASTAPAMQIMAKGDFHDVDGTATGVAELVALPDGAYEVILDTFSIDAIAHTNVVLVSNANVTKTADIDKSKLLDLGPLQGTDGMQVYAIPAGMAAAVIDGYHTVVIWDTAMAHAIAAAPLQ